MWNAKLNPLEFVMPAEITNSAWLQSTVTDGFDVRFMQEFQVQDYPDEC